MITLALLKQLLCGPVSRFCGGFPRMVASHYSALTAQLAKASLMSKLAKRPREILGQLLPKFGVGGEWPGELNKEVDCSMLCEGDAWRWCWAHQISTYSFWWGWKLLLPSVVEESEGWKLEVVGAPVKLLDTMLANSEYKYMYMYVLCPGICSYAASFEEHIHFHTENLQVWQDPFHRHDCNTCSLWYKPSNGRLASSSPLFDCCAGCKDLYHNLTSLKRGSESLSLGHKEQWLDPSLNAP